MTDRLVETLTTALRQAAEGEGRRPPDALAETVRRRALRQRRRRTIAAGASTLAVVVTLVAIVWQSWGVLRVVDGPVGVPSTTSTTAVSVGPSRTPVASSPARTGVAMPGPGPAASVGIEVQGSPAALAVIAAAAPGAGPRLVPRIESGQGSPVLVVPTGRVPLPATTPGVAQWHTTQRGWVVLVMPSVEDGQTRLYAVTRDLSLRLLDSGHLGPVVVDPSGTRVAYVRHRSVPGQPEANDGMLAVADVVTGAVGATWPEPLGVTWTPSRWLPAGLVLVTSLDSWPTIPQSAQLIDVATGILRPISGWGPVLSVAGLPDGGPYDTAVVRASGNRQCVELVRGLDRGLEVTCALEGVLRPNPYGTLWSFEGRTDGGQRTQLIDISTGELLAYHPPEGLPGVGQSALTWEDATHAYACVGQSGSTVSATLCPRFAVRWDVTSGRWERIAL